jgi:hypothetical protein
MYFIIFWHIFRFSQAFAQSHTTASEMEPSWNLRSSDFSPQNSRNVFAYKIKLLCWDLYDSKIGNTRIQILTNYIW